MATALKRPKALSITDVFSFFLAFVADYGVAQQISQKFTIRCH